MKSKVSQYAAQSRVRGENVIQNNNSVVHRDLEDNLPAELSSKSRKWFRIAVGAGAFLTFGRQVDFYSEFVKGFTDIKSEKLTKMLNSDTPGLLSEIFPGLDIGNSIGTGIDGLNQGFNSLVDKVQGLLTMLSTKKQSNLNRIFIKFAEETPNEILESWHDTVGSVGDDNSVFAKYPASKTFLLPDYYVGIFSQVKVMIEAVEPDEEKVKTFKSKLLTYVDMLLSEAGVVSKKVVDLTARIKEHVESESERANANLNLSLQTINKKSKSVMSDQFAKNYHKDALKGLDNSDSLMKEFYNGMASFYDEETKPSDSRKGKDLINLSKDEEDKVQMAHPNKVYVGKSHSDGGLVENGHQSREKSETNMKTPPSGNFQNK